MKTDDAGLYFFSRPVSHVDWGCREERPLAYDGFEELARGGKIYWLDSRRDEASIAGAARRTICTRTLISNFGAT
jgi:hypothetical protein